MLQQHNVKCKLMPIGILLSVELYTSRINLLDFRIVAYIGSIFK